MQKRVYPVANELVDEKPNCKQEEALSTESYRPLSSILRMSKGDYMQSKFSPCGFRQNLISWYSLLKIIEIWK